MTMTIAARLPDLRARCWAALARASTVLVVNQHSLSDAEDFTEGYRTLKLGKVVGEPTAGWIIYTGAMELVDGSSMRLPGTLITGADGKNMENNPRPVDVAVSRRSVRVTRGRIRSWMLHETVTGRFRNQVVRVGQVGNLRRIGNPPVWMRNYLRADCQSAAGSNLPTKICS